FDAARPVILNGIEDIVTRPDLADRAVSLTLEPIPEEHRRPEQELWAAFEVERPRILGVLLDAVVEGLKRLPETRDPRRWAQWPALPRSGRRDVAGGGNRHHRLARDRQPASALPPCCRDAAFAGAGARRIGGDTPLLPQCPVRYRLRAGGRLG